MWRVVPQVDGPGDGAYHRAQIWVRSPFAPARHVPTSETRIAPTEEPDSRGRSAAHRLRHTGSRSRGAGAATTATATGGRRGGAGSSAGPDCGTAPRTEGT